MVDSGFSVQRCTAQRAGAHVEGVQRDARRSLVVDRPEAPRSANKHEMPRPWAHVAAYSPMHPPAQCLRSRELRHNCCRGALARAFIKTEGLDGGEAHIHRYEPPA